jgi:hypothetical protein
MKIPCVMDSLQVVEKGWRGGVGPKGTSEGPLRGSAPLEAPLETFVLTRLSASLGRFRPCGGTRLSSLCAQSP